MAGNTNQLAVFLSELAQALHISGMPAHDLEQSLNGIGQRFGVRVECFAVLTMLALKITSGDAQSRTEMVRLRPYDYNMSRLIALEQLVRKAEGMDQIDLCAAQLREIMRTPARWTGLPFMLFGFALSASVALLLRGGWTEMFCGGLVGLLFVGAYLGLSRFPRLGPALPVILCTLAAMAAQLSSLAFPLQSVFITTVAGVVFLLPGFTITIAMSELATQNLLSGTGRLAGACLLLFMMIAGVLIGTQLSEHLLPAHTTIAPQAIPDWAIWPAIAALGISMLGVLQAPLRAAHVLVAGSLLAWAVFSLVGSLLGNVVGAFAGALAVATAGHCYTYFTGQPGILLKIPGLIVLVPGSMGFRGVHALVENNSMAGMNLMTDVALTGAVLAVGLLLADNIGPLLFPRKE